MRGKVSVWVLVLATASCGSTGPFLYSGKDIQNASAGLEVRRSKNPDWVVVGSTKYLFVLSLPYAEDWELESTLKDPLFATSGSVPLVTSIKFYMEKDKRKVEEAGYLQGILKNQTVVSEKLGGKLVDAAVTKQGDHSVLEYRIDLVVEGRTFHQHHFWGSRQNKEGLIYDIHLSTTCMDEVKLAELREKARDILARRFEIVP